MQKLIGETEEQYKNLLKKLNTSRDAVSLDEHNHRVQNQ